MTDRIEFKSEMSVEGRRIKGSVKFAGQRTRRGGEWVEVDPAALVKADAANAVARFNHDEEKVLARMSNGTLSITRTEQGIDYETGDLPNVSYANDALELVRGGYTAGSSFALDGIRSTFSTDPETGDRVRRITHIDRLVDVSPVFDPAFLSEVAAFSKESDVTEPITEPVAPAPVPQPVVTNVAQFKQAADDVFATTEAFARTLDSDRIVQAMDNLMTESQGVLKGDMLKQYSAYAKVHGEITQASAEEQAAALRFKQMHDIRMGRGPKAPASAELFASDDYKEAFKRYLRSTVDTLSRNAANMEQFAQTVSGSGAEGGFTVPDGFVNRLTERLKAYGGIATVADEITTTTGESLRWPYIDDTGNKAQLVLEDTQASTGADLVFDNIELGAFEYDATGASGNPIEVSLTLLQDSAFDIEGRLTDLLGTRIGRKQADHFATGAGGTEPVGLFTKTADTMTATVASLAAPEHIFQVDPAYRPNGRWVMSDTTLAKLWTAQATTNEPLFQPGRTLDGKPFDVLFGYPITIDNSAGNLVAFGDIKAGYIIRRVRGVQLLVDPYTAQKRRAVQYHAWARADANIQDPNAYSVSTWASVTADT